mmetsp:Transcript_47255/g.136127  ORF Transcript_47255/g.136127 Transcript_47255/m.136127 type:complete len:91 (-) Transcript_47255:111-383(-)|eukprot:CAMPEP_0176085996 /NCGR_PEP_ID=MMETSP0120_2-20121206/43045_1 /TAXON_ID=160619 /ORGANISM="Kryptoperidinium foliaceum, Strain CCMP 1326" /LENGTH=90 /DNA_ID=CAMNT_0017419823 /DNA_START=60 /DNA_END=332 /DNA_ORIENTATION=+
MAALRSTELTRLYRQILRNAGTFSDYNFRCYFQRRAREDFRDFSAKKLRGEVDDAAHKAFIERSQEQLNMLKRQGTLNSFYGAAPPRTKR